MTTQNQFFKGPLALKPDMAEACRRWKAYWNHEIIDRPLVKITAPVSGYSHRGGTGYLERHTREMDGLLDDTLHNLKGTIYGGESIPAMWTSLGTDELGVFCGSKFVYSKDYETTGTVWCTHPVDNWTDFLPLRVQEQGEAWQRSLALYRAAAKKLAGQALLFQFDSHANMDILMSLRGSERLCLDVLDTPELIDKAMADCHMVFRKAWETFSLAGEMAKNGYWHDFYHPDGVYCLACDFIAFLGPELFRRWVAPCLEKDAALVKNCWFHWDGPDALRHADDLLAMPFLHTMSYVPSPGVSHVAHIELYRKVQKAGKAVLVGGTFDECKILHRELDPALTAYSLGAGSAREMDEILKWFVENT